jgi:hypothetical protein
VADPDSGLRRQVDAWRDVFHGELLCPGDRGYAEHRRVWNGAIDRHPSLIARCAGVADVVESVRFAHRHELRAAVRSGGHSFPGLSVCDGGMVIDLSQLKGVRVDVANRVVRVQAGLRLGELDRETQEFGLAVPAGIVSHTGLAGLALGGGIGWLMRKHGLTVDQLLAVDMVTADAQLIRADVRENSELFWAVRGGGGNFGIVTDFEFRLQPVGPRVLAGPIIWPMERSPEVLRFYRDWISDVPDELTTIVVHRKAPVSPVLPTELHGRPIVMVVCCYSGSVEEGQRVVRPMRSFGAPLLDLCTEKPFVAHQAMFDTSFPEGWWYYFRSCDVAALTDEVIDITAEHAQRIRSPLTAFPIFHLGGAVARVGEDATAFHGRGTGHVFNINAITASEEGFAEEREWARTFWQALEPHQHGVYVNFLMQEGNSACWRPTERPSTSGSGWSNAGTTRATSSG